MKVEMLPIDSIKPYEKNPRKNAAAIPEVVRSLKEFGFRQPLVVDKNMVLVVGHTRLKAAQELGLTKVPVHIATELTQAQAKAYRLMDNRTNERSEWDKDLLLEEIGELTHMEPDFDTEFLGFEDAMLYPADPWETDIAGKEAVDKIDETDLGITKTIKIRILQTHAHELLEIIKDAVSEAGGAWGEVVIA